jgi:hypothetical protein
MADNAKLERFELQFSETCLGSDDEAGVITPLDYPTGTIR